MPDGVTSEVAASVLLKGLTAHYLLKSVYPVQSGDAVLVHAGAGGVGLILTQWARLLGARVITTVSTAEKERLSRQAGADEVLPYPDDAAEFGQRIRALTGGAGVAAVYDGVGATTFDASLASLAVRGTLALFGASSGPVPPIDPQRLNAAGSVFLTRPSLVHFIRTGTRVQLARRGIVRRGCRRSHHHRSRRTLSAGRSGPRSPGPAGPQDGRLGRAASLSCRVSGKRLDGRHWQGRQCQSRVGSAITESTANAQNTTAR